MFSTRLFALWFCPSFLRFLFVCLLLGAAFAASGAVERPNVIVIFTDDQGYEDLSSFGSPDIDTPELDRMADEGLRLTDFHVASSVCSASRASLLTGRKPLHHKVQGALFPNAAGMNNSEQTIADMLKAVGYSTALFGKWHLGEKTSEDLPMGFGFDTYFGIPYSNDMYLSPALAFASDIVLREGYTLEQAEADRVNRPRNKVPLLEGDLVVEYPADQASLTRRYFDRAIGMIESVTASDPEHPFFIYIAPAMPHIPLYASSEFLGTSERGLYGDVVEEIDFHVGRLLQHLRASGLDERTLVVFTSDNGPWLSAGVNKGDSFPYVGGKFEVNEGASRVPCVMWWPGTWPAGQVSEHLVSAVDLLPTIAHYSGAALPEAYLAGFNVSHHLENTSVPTGKPYDVVQVGNYASLRQGRWKYQPSGERGQGPPGLFDIVADPAQSENLYASEPTMVSSLQVAYDEYFATASATVDNDPPAAPAIGTATPGPRSILLDWPASPEGNLAHYLVFRSATAGGPYQPIALTVTDDYTDEVPRLGEMNYYAVRAVDLRGNQSPLGPEMSASPGERLPGSGVIDIIGNTTGAPGGEFADYLALASGADWEDSSVIDAAVQLSVSRTGLNGERSASYWYNQYVGANAEINFARASGDAASPGDALSQRTFIAIQLESREPEGERFTMDRVTLALWRNGAQAADVYQLAYDFKGDGYDVDDFIGTPVVNNGEGSSATFQVVGALATALANQYEVRLYFWKQSGDGTASGNSHLFEVRAEYTLESDLAYKAWAGQYGGLAVIGPASADHDGDGVSNFLEYALNGDPTRASDQGRVELLTDGTVFRLAYAQHLTDERLVYRVLDRVDLASGSVGVDTWSYRSYGATQGDYIMVENHYPLEEEPRRFFQVEVIAP